MTALDMQGQARGTTAYEAEIRYLKDAVAALRGELEQTRFDQEAGVQKAVAGSADELAHVRGTVAALRENLERLRFDKEAGVQAAVAAAADESPAQGHGGPMAAVAAAADEIDLIGRGGDRPLYARLLFEVGRRTLDLGDQRLQLFAQRNFLV